MRRYLTTLAFLVAALVSVGPAAAQSVGGKVVEAGTDKPIAGALVVLLDAHGKQRAQVLTDEAGHFYIQAPGPGRYTLRTDRIGFRSVTSPEMTLAKGDDVSRRIEAPIQPIVLDTISATGSGRCHTPRDVGAATYLLWEEARKALAITALERERGMPYQTVRYERARDLVSLDILDDQSQVHSGYGTPFHSVPARDLAKHGFVRALEDGGYRYYGLDAPTLLSDAFLDTHCFRIRPADAEHIGQIGLGFEPTPSNHNPDITGVLWLDRKSDELRTIDFNYTRHLYRLPLPTAPFGGHIHFRRLSNGAWIVDRWWLRMPQVAIGARVPARTRRPTDTESDELMAAARAGVSILEAGGDIRYMVEPGPLADAFGDAAVAGVVYDSTRDRPLAGATVFLTHTRRSATTDDAGRFRIGGVPAGANQIAFFDPYSDSLGLPITPRPVHLPHGGAARVRLFIPGAAGCPDQNNAPTAAITGFVYDSAGKPLADVEVTAAWHVGFVSGGTILGPTRSHTARTSNQGRFLLCGVGIGDTVRVTAHHRGEDTTVEMKIDRPGLVRQDVQVTGSPR